jgi:hypothetical protein
VRGFGGNRSGSGKNHGHAYGALDEAQTMSQPDPERLKLARKTYLKAASEAQRATKAALQSATESQVRLELERLKECLVAKIK